MSNKKSLKIVEQIAIKSPCHESWDQMTGNEQKKHCASCQLSVTNLSAFTKEHAAKLLSQQAGQRMCVRYNIMANGDIRFKAAPSWSMLWKNTAMAIATLCAAIGLSSAAFADNIENPTLRDSSEENILMGKPVQYEAPPSPTPEVEKQMMGAIAPPSESPTPAPTEAATTNQVTPQGDVIKMGKIKIN